MPPQVDGVGDHAYRLAQLLENDFGFNASFLIGDPLWPGEERTWTLASQSSKELERRLKDHSHLCLHYVGYGYHKRGIPFWLVDPLIRWRKKASGRFLFVVFHELWSSGPPWKSEFYLGHLQKLLVQRLAIAADSMITSTLLMEQMLQKFSTRTVVRLPIPSPFPEGGESKTLEELNREPHSGIRLMAFGQSASRCASILAHTNLIQELHRKGQLDRVFLMGKGASRKPIPCKEIEILRRFIPDHLIEVIGEVLPEVGGDWLGKSDLLLSYYPAALACKSSSLMAAMSRGCIPVLGDDSSSAPLHEGTHFLVNRSDGSSLPQLLRFLESDGIHSLRNQCQQWYRENASWSVVAGKVATLLEQVEAQRIT